MTSDEERREAAAKLRAKKEDFFGVRSFFPQDLILYQSLYLKAIDECLPDCDCCFDVLAELIDRPTCHNVYDEHEMARAPTGSNAACAATASRISSTTASRGRSITARSAGRRWWTNERHVHMRFMRQAHAELQAVVVWHQLWEARILVVRRLRREVRTRTRMGKRAVATGRDHVPWCGYVDTDSWEFEGEYDDEYECPSCGKQFILERVVDITYTSKRRIEDMPEGWMENERGHLSPLRHVRRLGC